MIVRILCWLLVLEAVWCCLGSPYPVRTSQSRANESFKRVGNELDAMHAESAATELHRSLGLSDMVARIRDGKIENETIHAIEAILRNTNEIHIHRMRGGEENRVFVSPDGHSEGVYDGNGELVKDGINDGSYNYFHPRTDALRHFSIDSGSRDKILQPVLNESMHTPPMCLMA